MRTSGEYHENIRGCSVHRGNIMSTYALGDVQYIGGYCDACEGIP